MFTINLEKSLLKENKKLITPDELLIVNEYEKHAGLVNNDALERIGMNKKLKEGDDIKTRINNKLTQTKKYNQEKVFHISQIKNICEKYYLKFLPSNLYNGFIDDKLPERITTFELAYGEECNRKNTFIIAPQESFKLQEKPKDPLFFYKINDEYYYLIHKWGNDLNVLNRCKSILTNPFLSVLIISFVFTLPLLFIQFPFYLVISLILFVGTGLYNIITSLDRDDGIFTRLFKRNQFDSDFRN